MLSCCGPVKILWQVVFGPQHQQGKEDVKKVLGKRGERPLGEQLGSWESRRRGNQGILEPFQCTSTPPNKSQA